MDDGWILHTPRAPGTAGRKGYPMAVPKYYNPCFVFLLTEKVWERELHFDTEIGRTVPCPQTKACSYCAHGVGTRPTGYTCGVWCEGRALVVVQLSDAALNTYGVLAADGQPMRGRGMKTSRADTRKNAKMILEQIQSSEDEFLPGEFDIRPTMELVFGNSSWTQFRGRSATDPQREQTRIGRKGDR